MSKRLNLFAILVLALMVMFTVSCEGPAGEMGLTGADGAVGADGADAQVTCLSCHDSDTMLDNQLELARSQHGLGDVAVGYAGGRAGCAQCHSHEGFVEWATTGTIGDANYTTPSPWQCSTCHGLHRTFTEEFDEATDYALRVNDPVVAMFDETVTLDIDPSSNLCVNCHQSRRGYDSMVDEGGLTGTLTSSHAGPHHGPQANLLSGNNGSMAGEPFAPHLGAGCVGCHMTEATGDETNINGGHTFWAVAEKCNDCHTGPDVVFDASRDSEFEHEGYYDYKGFQTEIADKLHELGGLLVTEGILDSTHSTVPGTYDIDTYKAWWNYIFIAEDRSHGVHNPYWTESLLDEGITALTP
ncbi:MAG: cytochrome c3 family protein [Candidatus Marinimicrobia bacterium]|nr:cytochrome c3 family protein [Candidatus Neomarinimicrobiota bacterium]